MEYMEKDIYKCSFCDKPEGPNRQLIGNPEGDSFICEECISLCRDLLRGKPKLQDKELKLLTPKEIKEKLDDLYELAKKKATPVVEGAVEDLRNSAIKVTKEVLTKLEKVEK